MTDRPTVSDLYRRAVQIRERNNSISYADMSKQLVVETSGKEFPDPAYLTIPELDNIAPEEDWTAGLPIVLRGIQSENWKEIIHGIIICLEQVENFAVGSGREDAPEKEWRNRDKRIAEAEKVNFDKWMPEELMDLAKKSTGQ